MMDQDPSYSCTSIVVQQQPHPHCQNSAKYPVKLHGDRIVISKRGRCRNSRGNFSNRSVASSRMTIERFNIPLKTTASIGSPKPLKHNTGVQNLQELPQEVLLRIVKWIDSSCPKNSSMIALSETSKMMNYICHIYLVRRWDVSSLSTIRIADADTIRKDGVIQRLQLQDPKFTEELYTEYILGGDNDDNIFANRQLDSLNISIGSKMFHATTTDMIQAWIRCVLQKKQFVFRDIYQQLAICYCYHHGLNATRIRFQEELAAFLYPHSKLGISFLIVMFVLWRTLCSVIYDNLLDTSNNATINTVIILILCFVCVALTSITLFIVTTAASVSNLLRRNQQQLYVAGDTTNRDAHTVSATIKSNSVLEHETAFRRSYSQPEFVSFTSSETSIATNTMEDMTTASPTLRVPLKRSQTIASSSPASFGESNYYDDLDNDCYISSNIYNHEEQAILSERHIPTTELSFDYGYSSEEDEFESFLHSDDEGDVVDLAMENNKSAVVRDRCFINLSKDTSAFQSSAGLEAMPVSITKPQGWVGMYRHALHLAKKRIVHMVNDSRAFAYKALNMNERNDLSSSLMNACIFNSDNAVSVMQLLSKSIPTQDFYIGVDGTESCALHTAAFHGSSKVIDFLCRGIDTTYYYCDRPTTFSSGTVGSASFEYNDGGFCNVNVTDMNGWTALHYAVGANSVDAVRVLLSYGAKLHIPAANGYTPLQWAIRLQHHNVTNELRSAMMDNQQEQQSHSYSYQVLEKIKHSIFTIIVLSLLCIPNYGLMYVNSDSA